MLPTQNEPCTMCEECIKACPTGARQVTGREMTVEDVVREVMRDRMFAELPQDWRAAYDAGIFTEFMEQRAPGHTVLDGKIYRKGMLDFKADIARAASSLDFLADPEAYEKRETLKSFDIACDGVIAFAAGHAALARDLADRETRPQRRAELLKIADVCDRVPAHAPRDFHEALQYYWFCHLAAITELNGLIQVLGRDFENEEVLRRRLVNRTHKYGNDDDYADDIMRMVFAACFEEIDGRPDARGGRCRVEMLPTTSHVHFGSVTGAMPDGRKAGLPLSEGISPVQGADRRGRSVQSCWQRGRNYNRTNRTSHW